jgi:hypothetical protein
VAHGSAAAQGAAVGPGGAAAGGRYASGTAVEGPRGNVYTHDTTASRGAAVGPQGFEAGRSASTGSTFEGAGGATYSRGISGSQGIAAGPRGVAAGGSVSAGRAVEGPAGNVYARGATAQRGVAAGSYGYAAGGRAGYAAYGTHAWSPTYYHVQAIAGQRWFVANPVFTPAWCTAHPWAWYPARYAPAAWAAAVWAPVTWASLSPWLGYAAVEPSNYSYGDSITYQNGNVYYGDLPAGTAQQYYQEASTLANPAAAANSSPDEEWLPLGVFGLMPPGQKTPEMVFQLAVNKAGILRGNYYDKESKTNLPVQGSVNKQIQRVAWSVAGKKDLVVETGLYNLTQQESTALVHLGPNRTQQDLLVRLKQPADGQPDEN